MLSGWRDKPGIFQQTSLEKIEGALCLGLYVKPEILANTLIDSDFQRFDSDFHYNDKFYQGFESISQYPEIHSQVKCSAFKIVT